MIVSSTRKLPIYGIGFYDLMAARLVFAKLAQNLPTSNHRYRSLPPED